MTDDQRICDVLIEIGVQVRRRIHQSLQQQSVEERSSVFKESADDTIYRIDRDVEDILVPLLEREAERLGGIVLVAEGIHETGMVLPANLPEEQAALRIIIDPIDGTREIMYDKRSAYFLAGAAVNRGGATSMQDIRAAVMVELPTSRCYLGDLLWAIKGQGARRMTEHLFTGERKTQAVTPSRAKSIYGGFAQISRLFPPGREVLAALDEELVATLFPHAPAQRAYLFEDQYISAGGQLAEMLLGHYRFLADLRAALYRRFAREGRTVGLTSHPYDLCTSLIGTEAGLLITDVTGAPLSSPLDTTSAMDWIIYANADIRREVEPVLQKLLVRYELL